MNKPLDTDEWEFYSTVGYKAKYLGYENCSRCGGRGKIGGGWANPDDPEKCRACQGSGKTYKEPKTEKPEVPPELIERLKATYQAYIAEQVMKHGII